MRQKTATQRTTKWQKVTQRAYGENNSPSTHDVDGLLFSQAKNLA
jgi:hypothetical protein